jgi:PAS domain S-box-containing protein
MSIFRNSSIKRKLSLVIILTTGIALLFSSGLLIPYEMNTFQSTLINNLKVQAEIIGSNSIAAVTFKDRKTAEEILSALRSSPNIEVAVMYSGDGSVFAEYRRYDIKGDFSAPGPREDHYYLGYDHLDLFHSITFEGKKIGTLFIRSDVRELYLRLIWFAGAIFVIMVLSLLLSLLLSSKLQQAVTTPVLDLMKVMNTISSDKDYSLRASVHSSDEIGTLTEGFNDMLSQIQSRDAELEEHRKTLEKMVAERTDDLDKANKQLQEELATRRKAEESLSLEKEQLAVTLRSIADGVITSDVDGNVVLMNSVAENMTGWTLREAAGKQTSDIFIVMHERSREPCEAPVKSVVKSGELVECNDYVILTDRHGKERIISASVAPMSGRDNHIVGAVIVFQDMSVRKQMEEDILRTQKLESIGVLAGGIAHDFNNLLTAILGNVSLAKLLVSPQEKIFQRLTAAENASLRARDLTQQLLTFSKGGAPVRKTTSIGALMRDSVSFALSGSNVICEFAIPDDLWAVDIDEGQISQVVHNLIINAEQAMPGGGTIKLNCRNIAVSEESGLPLKNGKYIRISVTDQGEGISPKYLPKIFDPYFTTKEKGRGLGLAMVYSIIRNHEGHITLESQIGVGTTFRIYLPASRSEISGYEIEESSLRTAGGKILVMDDEEIIRESMFEILSFAGYEVEFAKDGTEAIEAYVRAKADNKPFDMVIMDLTIPGGMGGKEAVERLREIDPEIKAIVSSGYSNDPVMANFRAYGFEGAVSKPYKVAEIVDTLYKVIKSADEKNDH